MDLAIQKLPRIRTIELPDRNAGGIFRSHHAGIDGNPAIVGLLNTLVVRGASTGIAMIKLNAFITPEIGRDCTGRAHDIRLLPGVIGPLRTNFMADGAIAYRERLWLFRKLNINRTTMAGGSEHGLFRFPPAGCGPIHHR